MKNEKVLITGGAGFIGSHLTRALLGVGRSVRILDCLAPQIHGEVPAGLEWLNEPNIEYIRGSVTNEADVRNALIGVDTVVHLAAETGTGQSMYEIARYNTVNVGGTSLLLDVLANNPKRSVKRIVLASSRSIYGEGAYICPGCNDQKRHYPNGRKVVQLTEHRWEHSCPACGSELEPVATREDDLAKPGSIYAATKYAQEDLVRVACSALEIDYAILRLQNVYGEGQSLKNPYTGILSIFSTRIRRGQHLPIFEDGQETRDFVHVQDVILSFLAAIQYPHGLAMTCNVGMGVKLTVAETASRLCDAFGVKPNLVTTKEFRLGDIRHNFADIARLQETLGYRPQINIGVGMQRFAEWALKQTLPEDKLEQANAELKSRGFMGYK
jgi:dTDP-L-rhamnose 4-epimerase